MVPSKETDKDHITEETEHTTETHTSFPESDCRRFFKISSRVAQASLPQLCLLPANPRPLLTSWPLLPVSRDPRAPTCAGTLILHTDGPADRTLLIP